MPSTHSVKVVRIPEIRKHPNADTLGLVDIFGYTCAIRFGDFVPGDLAAYIEPDSVVPATPEFEFLGEHRRIKVRKLRGVYSQGLLIKAPPGAAEGDDVMAALGITHYDPPLPPFAGGETEAPPPGTWPHYDVESLRRFPGVFMADEGVVATEKLHGTSARYAFVDGRMRVSSHTEWKCETENNLYWRALRATPWLEPFCLAHPDLGVYGEVFGSVQVLRYGVKKGSGVVFFRAFDLWDRTSRLWIHVDEFEDLLAPECRVPVLYRGPFDLTTLTSLAEGKSTMPGADHVREGVVIRPVVERWSEVVGGRAQAKIVGNGYLEKA